MQSSRAPNRLLPSNSARREPWRDYLQSLKLFGALHASATHAAESTGNVFAVRDIVGHEDLVTTAICQHPQLGAIRDAIGARKSERVMCESRQNPHNPKTMPTSHGGQLVKTKEVTGADDRT